MSAQPRPDSPSGWSRRQVVNTVARLVIMALGVYVMVAAYGMGIGSLSTPGSGLWPLIAGAGFVGFTVYLIIAERHTEAEALTANSWKIPVALGSLLVFTVMLAYLGLTIPVFILLLIWLRVLGGEPTGLSLLLAAGASAVLYLLFVVALAVPFPPDFLLTLVGLEGA